MSETRTAAPRAPRLLLEPASPAGWLEGRTLEASGASGVVTNVALGEAAEALEAQFDGEVESAVTAVLAEYSGRCAVIRFASARDVAASGDAVGCAEVPDAATPRIAPADPLLGEAEWDLSARGFRAAVEETRERIAAGDVYVLNLTARLEGECTAPSPEAAFAALARRASADMAALLTGLPGPIPWIASVSPERFVRVRRAGRGPGAPRVVEIEPIKGTRPRGADPAADARFAAELLSDAKERSEHVMVVDLERNDLGVSCVPGSVHVDPLYSVVSTPYCHQLVSRVRGVLRCDASFGELLCATFPCGSVTGAPKLAAMRIAGELEATPRGAYCGALLVAVPGELDSSVLIRTLEGIDGQPSRARFGAGCGITFDSDAAAEHLEALLKASLVTGDGLPPVALRETMRVSSGRVPLLDRHLARLASGGAGPSALARVREAVAGELASAGSRASRCRVGVTIGPGGDVEAELTTLPSSLEVEGGPVLVPVEVAAAPLLPPNAAKPADRGHWDRAHRTAELSGAHQAALHTPDGSLVDGSTATLWLVIGGRLATPPAPPAVSGVARGLVFDAAERLGIPAEERPLTLTDLDAASEVFLSNAVGSVVPARGRSGPVCADIATTAAGQSE